MNDVRKQKKASNGVGSGELVRPLVFPRVGDEWEFQLPGKSKKRKIVGSISVEWHQGEWNPDTCRYEKTKHPRVNWQRRNKGRYTSIRVKWLLKHGQRISTEAERTAKFDARMAELDRPNNRDEPTPASGGKTK